MTITRFESLVTILKNMTSKYYYAVAKGRKPGIYHTWPECHQQVLHFSGPVFKKFKTEAEARGFIEEHEKANKENDVKDALPIIGKRQRIQSDKSTDSDTVQSSSKKVKTTGSTKYENIWIDKDLTKNLIMDSDGFVNVYTDGACTANGRKNAKAGIGVWFGDNHPLNVSEAVVGRATNNNAEIKAVTVAARQARKAGIKNLKINTDSQFLINCIKFWIHSWKKKGWVTSNNTRVINKDELIEMEKALKPLNVVWNHVNGHVGIYGNEMADKLARAGCSKYNI
ncbi:ribonuclease H1 [Bombus pyrosoma]|uniref:ribonuclease H1 n=1 Tax=Bombus pyrosoma TaxID=396416 RepID=UPI001CB979AB|nr:ribonuclease H1 [Bombus pyrosoma]XP_043605768.1 ribonuclease H1 [Bombus pyrosoma]XP_043605769.1 ribonuclease H1 [Bombus pyrosoma]XP_043605770.1 ribonuclease H1 [Bombus pyrosoma]XP_043605771.1 ribonuclease H1 [Bombus pyrosoma]XP_043605772.1 ribonuclease H1 [Bombus pyrosoma]